MQDLTVLHNYYVYKGTGVPCSAEGFSCCHVIERRMGACIGLVSIPMSGKVQHMAAGWQSFTASKGQTEAYECSPGLCQSIKPWESIAMPAVVGVSALSAGEKHRYTPSHILCSAAHLCCIDEYANIKYHTNSGSREVDYKPRKLHLSPNELHCK